MHRAFSFLNFSFNQEGTTQAPGNQNLHLQRQGGLQGSL